MTLNKWRQRYEFVDSTGTVINLTYVIYNEIHNKCYFFTYTSEMKSAPISTSPSSTKFVVCKDRHLHVPRNKIDSSEDKSIHNVINTPNIRSVYKGKERNCSKHSDTNIQESTTLDSKGQDAKEDSDSLHLFLQAAKTVGDFEERLEQLQRPYVREAKRIPETI